MENNEKNEGLNEEKLNTGSNDRDIFERTARYDPTEKRAQDGFSSANSGDEAYTDIKIKSPFFAKLENFFYHYKWHTIAAIAVTVFLVFAILQTCQRTTYDAYLLYAGGMNVRTERVSDEKTVYEQLYSAGTRFVSDYDGDGERNLSLLDIYLPSDEQIRELEDGNGSVNYTLLAENDELFRQNILYGDYYICLVSESLFLEWTKNERSNPFAKISEYLPAGETIAESAEENGYILCGEYGVYLSSTPIADNPGFESLPEDTVLTIRKYTGVGSGSKKRAEERYANAEQVFKNMLADKAYG